MTTHEQNNEISIALSNLAAAITEMKTVFEGKELRVIVSSQRGSCCYFETYSTVDAIKNCPLLLEAVRKYPGSFISAFDGYGNDIDGYLNDVNRWKTA